MLPDHNCLDYLVYHVAGEYYCDHKSHNSEFYDGVFFFTDFGFTPEDVANNFYEFWNKPGSRDYENDKEMKEFFEECVKDNTHYHPLAI